MTVLWVGHYIVLCMGRHVLSTSLYKSRFRNIWGRVVAYWKNWIYNCNLAGWSFAMTRNGHLCEIRLSKKRKKSDINTGYTRHIFAVFIGIWILLQKQRRFWSEKLGLKLADFLHYIVQVIQTFPIHCSKTALKSWHLKMLIKLCWQLVLSSIFTVISLLQTLKFYSK